MTAEEQPRKHHVCPWWVGYLLASPIRRWLENPRAILEPIVRPGQTVVDIGSAMGFFSLPAARLAGPEGRVVCVDVQERMLRSLERRARRKGLASIIETRICSQEDLGLADMEGTADVVLAIHVVHEAAYPKRFLRQLAGLLRPGGRLLLAEPAGHVDEEAFEEELGIAEGFGLLRGEVRVTRRSRSVLLSKPMER